MQSPELKTHLSAGAALAGSGPPTSSSDLRSILASRLTQYTELLKLPPFDHEGTLEEAQLETAAAALNVIQGVQNLLQDDSEMIGIRDMAQLRILSSVIFKWAIEPLLSRVISAIPAIGGGSERSAMKIIDLTTVPDDYTHLSSAVTTLLHLLLPKGPSGPLSNSPITADLVDKHLADLLKPCIVLGWLPKSLSSESIIPMDGVRQTVVHIVSNIPVSQSVTALSSVLTGPYPAYTRKACGFLLSRQILRRDGVRGLFIALFSEEDVSGDAAPLEKLEHVARLLQAVPTGMNDTDYYQAVIPQLVSILSTDPGTVPPTHSRAAAFTLSRMLVSSHQTSRSTMAPRILLTSLHRSLLIPSTPNTNIGSNGTADSNAAATPKAVLNTLMAFLTNTDPAPGLISNLLTPVVPSLFTLLHTVEEHKAADPTLKTSLRGLLETWGRLVEDAEAVATLWLIVDGEGGNWAVDVAGEITRVADEAPHRTSLSFFTPEDLRRAEEAGELDANANILHLRPDPIRFVGYLKSIGRVDISSNIFVKLLEAYQEAKGDNENDPMRTLLYLQIIMQMQSQLTADNSSANILKKPEHILTFVKHALEAPFTSPKSSRGKEDNPHKGLKLEDLRIVDIPEDQEELDGDSDDEDTSGSSNNSSDDEMTVTATNLLLSILEANPDMNTENTPILDDIFDLLVRLAKEGSESVRPLAREARMVLTARLASTSVPIATSKTKRTSVEQTSQDTYQKALKLLQDPLLPVRAHGLLLLRQLVASRATKTGEIEPPALDRALVPGILSIFLQSLQDDDSYIYLNAVQGLAAMVDGFGKEVLKGLVEMYAHGMEGTGSTILTKQDVDNRTKIGEALGQVIKRCGETLPLYSNMLVPSLFSMVRTSHLPTTLRTSALSLLAQCANSSSLALLPYIVDLTGGMVDLLQIETVPSAPRKRSQTSPEETEDTPPPTIDSHPTAANSKFPPLRRAALHFLSLLARAYVSKIAETPSDASYNLPSQLLQRANRTVGYIAVTDEDSVVRVMARETLEELNGLEELILGI